MSRSPSSSPCPPASRCPSARSSGGRLRGLRGRGPDRPPSGPRGAAGCGPGHPRRRSRRELARAHATMHRGGGPRLPALTVVSPRAFERLAASDDDSGDEYFTRPYSADAIRWRVEAMCIRRETDRRRQWADPPGRDSRCTPLGQTRGAHRRRLQSEGRRRQDDDRHEPRRGTPDAAREVRPARRRRYSHRPRHNVACHGGRPDGRRQLDAMKPKGDRPRRLPRSRRPTCRGCGSSPLTSSPLHTEILDPARVRR